MRVLGLDVGTVRIGVALSDPLGLTAQPLETIDARKSPPEERVRALCAEHEVTQLVVGLPLQLDGKEGLAVQSVRRFVDKLAAVVSLPIELWDERLTTAQAERTMISGGVRRDKRRERIDQIAAALILQSFLDAKRRPA
jgi:putative holliday junction resolvase